MSYFKVSPKQQLKTKALRVASAGRDVYWRNFHPETRGAQVAVTDPDGRLLLVGTSYGDRDSWSLPGGGLTRAEKRLGVDEGALRAAHRELRQEVGIEGIELNPLAIYWSDRQGNRDTLHWFQGIIGAGIDIVPASAEIAKVELFPLDNLPLTIDPNVLFVRMALEGRLPRHDEGLDNPQREYHSPVFTVLGR